MSSFFAPAFFDVYRLACNEEFEQFFIKGGRGSCKSSFVSLFIVLSLMRNKDFNAIVFRKVYGVMRDSVFEQLLWAIELLGVSHLWSAKVSPLMLCHRDTGQRILFRGVDKPSKIKSIKVKQGFFKFAWFEEAEEFSSMEEIRNVMQSVARGSERVISFFTFNPPKSPRNFMNLCVENLPKGAYCHHSTYLDVPCEWLSPSFFSLADSLREFNPTLYEHEYLGEVVGSGAEVFSNVKAYPISDADVLMFDNVLRGVDFGFSKDPFCYVVFHYDRKKRKIFIFHEVYKVGLSNSLSADLIKAENVFNKSVFCDSAEPKSIDFFRSVGIRAVKAKKGPDSVAFGIRFLQDLDEIVIDPKRCPNLYSEFVSYVFADDGLGGFKASPPVGADHGIDAVRYGLSSVMKAEGVSVLR